MSLSTFTRDRLYQLINPLTRGIHYLRENFYITTSGNFRTQTLTEVMLEVGADRILRR